MGTPNTFVYGDVETAWAAQDADEGTVQLSVGFAQAVSAAGRLIRQSYGNGFVQQNDVIDDAGTFTTAWAGTDGSQAGGVVDFAANYANPIPNTVAAVIHVDTIHAAHEWNALLAAREQSAAELDTLVLARLHVEWLQARAADPDLPEYAPIDADIAARWIRVPGRRSSMPPKRWRGCIVAESAHRPPLNHLTHLAATVNAPSVSSWRGLFMRRTLHVVLVDVGGRLEIGM